METAALRLLRSLEQRQLEEGVEVDEEGAQDEEGDEWASQWLHKKQIVMLCLAFTTLLLTRAGALHARSVAQRQHAAHVYAVLDQADHESTASSDEASAPGAQCEQRLRRGRLDTSALTGLRGLVVLHIALGHFTLKFGLDLMGGASMGLFYLLSGFVLMLGVADARQPIAFGAFMLKRWARVGPIYLLSNACVWFMDRGGWPNASLQALLTMTYLTSWCTALTPMDFFGQSLHLSNEPFNSVSWSISTMMFFYVVFPSMVPRLARMSPKYLRGFVVLMYGLQASSMCIAYSFKIEEPAQLARMFPPLRLPVFVMGICAALDRLYIAGSHPVHSVSNYVRDLQPWSRASPTRIAQLWIGFMAAAIFCGPRVLEWLEMSEEWSEFYRLWLEMCLPILFYHMLIAFTGDVYPSEARAKEDLVVRIFRRREVRWLGEISMSFYLMHEICQEVAFMAAISRGWWSSQTRPLSFTKANIMVAVLMPLTLSLISGWVLTSLVEKPIARCLLRKLPPANARHHPGYCSRPGS